MATKDELVQDIKDLSEKLGKSLPEDLAEQNHDQLTATLKVLRDEEKENLTPPKPTEPEAPKEEPKDYPVMAKGKAVPSKVGMLGEGEKALPEYFASKDIYANLVKKGYIIEPSK